MRMQGTGAAAGRTLTYRAAWREALAEALASDPEAVVIGEGVSQGGRHGVTAGLARRFGPARVRDAPAACDAILELGLGAALAGLRPIIEVVAEHTPPLAVERMIAAAARLLPADGHGPDVSLVIRLACDQAGLVPSLEAWLAGMPGCHVLAPAMVADARLMLRAAVAARSPVVMIEDRALLPMEGSLDPAVAEVDLHRAALRLAGGDVTLLAHGAQVFAALDAAALLTREGIAAEVVDLRCLQPLDMETISASVARTRRVVIVDAGPRQGAISAEIAARIVAEAFFDLDAPVRRLAGHAASTAAADIAAAARSLVRPVATLAG